MNVIVSGSIILHQHIYEHAIAIIERSNKEMSIAWAVRLKWHRMNNRANIYAYGNEIGGDGAINF